MTIDKDFPQLRELNGRPTLYVDNDPFLILSMQLNCDSCYSPDTIGDLFCQIKKLGGNSAACLLYWRLIEPQEGHYDFKILQAMIDSAIKYDMRIVLVWFGSYKNACMHYAPDWVQQNPDRFHRAHDRSGKELPYVACYNCDETRQKDTEAVCKVFSYLKENDTTHRVVLFQVNNETGIVGSDRCYCDTCSPLYEKGDYAAMGYRGPEVFSAVSNLAFQEDIAKAAKDVYPLPCYMNVWLAHYNPQEQPGREFPSGGAVHRVLDVYKEKKKYIDFVSPDIYTPSYYDFMKVCKDYTFESNPLYVAEHAIGSRGRAGNNAYYAFGEFAAIGFDPWAIDCAFPDRMEQPPYDLMDHRISESGYDLMHAYIPIRDAMIPVAKALGTENLKYWVQEASDDKRILDFGDVAVEIEFCDERIGCSRGMVIRQDATHFIVLGDKAYASFYNKEGIPFTLVNSDRGVFHGTQFISERRNTISWNSLARVIWLRECCVCTAEIGNLSERFQMTSFDPLSDIK